MPLKASERLTGLEELYIFASMSSANLSNLRNQGAIRAAASSLLSPDPAIANRALILNSLLLQGDRTACMQFAEEKDAIKTAVEFLNSANDYNRIEALHVMLSLAASGDTVLDLFRNHRMLMHMLVLIEEGLQLQSEFGFNLAHLALKVVDHWVHASKEKRSRVKVTPVEQVL